MSLEGFITDITYGKRQQLRSAESTLYDTATGLPTRQLFLDRLQRAVVRAHDNGDFDFALLLIQVDRYKRLESILGPAGMETLLKEIAARMQATLPSTSSVTRLDDGQFAVILDSGDMSLAVMDAAANLSKAMRAPVMMSSQEVLITVSIGIAVSSSGYQVRAHMLRDADIALDRALSLGGGRVEFFDHDQQSRAAALSHLQAEFNTAADRGQLEVHWRPVRLAGDDSLVGLVAMLAWRHPRRGLLYWEDHAKLVGGANTGRPLTHYLLAAVIDQQ